MSNIITNNELTQYVNTDHAIHYVQEIFKNAHDVDPAWMVEVRKIGTYSLIDGRTEPAEQSVAAQLLQFDQFNWLPGLSQWVAQKVITAAPIGIGAFMAPALLNDRRATDNSVVRLLTICADFDSGNPAEQLSKVSLALGAKPTMTCTSGGTTKEGFAKLHAHWRLDEPCDEPWKVAYIREQLAKKFGADQSFKRIPQIIRIPGALYDKQGKWSTTLITEFNNHDFSMLQFEEMLQIDWNNLDKDSIFAAGGGKSKEERADRLHQLQTEEVEAGRSEDTRWDRFSEYAGHQIRQARFGHQSVEEAFKSTVLWVNDKMIPAWDGQRIDAEFKALLQRDRINHENAWAERDKPPITFGNAPLPAQAPQVAATPEQPAAPVSTTPAWSLRTFRAKLLYGGDAPAERHLIENFMVHGSSCALVADGGVGKTYVALELALRAAAGPVVFNGTENNFMGFKILEKCVTIVFTVEDGQHDIHRRICAIDMDGTLREAAGDHCMIIPVQEQIMDGLTLAEKDSKGNFGPSKAWKALQGYIDDVMKDDGLRGLPLIVIIDTYSATHHGDENAATGTNEWFRAAGLLRKFEATLMLTHHVRKTDPKMEIRTPSDMKASVRGSSAFLNAVRTCFGIWEMPNGDAILKELPREKGARVFNMGILKNNTGISWADRSDPRYPDPMITLGRSGLGRLFFDALLHQKRLDLTNNKKERLDAARAQLRAAVVHAVRWYGEQGWPLSERNLTKDKDQFLPPKIRDMARDTEITPMIQSLISEGVLKQLKIKKVSGHVLDVPEGDYSKGLQSERATATPNMVWAQYNYDAENEEYVLIPNSQHVMDV